MVVVGGVRAEAKGRVDVGRLLFLFFFFVSLEREGVFEVQQEGSNFDEVEIEVVFCKESRV